MGTRFGLLADAFRPIVSRVAAGMATLLAAAALPPSRAAADHPGALAGAEMSPLTTALLSAGLALTTALVVVIIVMLLTRKGAGAEQSDE